MIKKLTLLILSLMFFVNVQAQQNNPPGTIIYFRDKAGLPTDKAHVNDVIFIYPADKTSGKKLYPVKEFYTNGAVKLSGKSTTTSSRPILVDTGTTYYPNGQKESVGNYKYGYLAGDVIYFYPDGKFNSIENYDKGKKFVSCKDSTGNVLADNGNGRWMQIEYIDYNKILNEGPVKDSLQEGEWHETVNNSIKYITTYKKGVAVSSTDPNQPIGDSIFVPIDQNPEYPDGGAVGFMKYISKNLKFPAYDRENQVKGRVVVSFVVERDGSLNDVKAIKSPDEYIAKAVVDIVKASPPWNPGMQNGLPVRVQYTIPFNFDLSQ